ncbi:MAG TPA: acyl-CoA thioesterase, partial [Solirubrobacteraceae bacterium]|nr:acyl-CoA thioesterase [Solirubrobacteraceae bacterium]
DHGPVEIVVRITRVGGSSVTVDHDIVRNDGEVAASGSSVLVAWDPVERRSRPLREDERARLNEALGATTA